MLREIGGGVTDQLSKRSFSSPNSPVVTFWHSALASRAASCLPRTAGPGLQFLIPRARHLIELKERSSLDSGNIAAPRHKVADEESRVIVSDAVAFMLRKSF